MASITGSGPPFSVLERSFHLLHAICIIMKISRRSVPGEWRLRPWRMQIFDWKIILARQRSFSLSLFLSPSSGGRLAREMFYIPQNACGRNCSLDTGLFPKRIFAARPPPIPSHGERLRDAAWRALIDLVLQKNSFFPLSQHHTNNTSLFIFLPRQCGFRALSLVQLTHCCFGM